MELSIIIPVFKVEKYIKKCLDSIFNQNVDIDSFEVIVINDGTPDNSMPIVRDCILGYNNVIIINQENQGLSVARNNGLKVARGEYVWFVDSDDWLRPNSIDNILKIISWGKVDVISTLLNRTSEWTGVNAKDKRCFYTDTDIIVSGKQYIFNEERYAPIQQFIFRRHFLQLNHLEFYPGIFHEDSQFGLRTLYLAQSVYLYGDCVYNYLQRDGSIMQSKSIKNARDLITIYRTLSDFGNEYVLSCDKTYWNASIAKILGLLFSWFPHLANDEEFISLVKKNSNLISSHIYDIVFSKHFRKANVKKAFLIKFFPIWYLRNNKKIL